MAKNLRTALIQSNLVWEDVSANRIQFEEQIQGLSAKVDLIILPEMFTTGFTMNAQQLAEPASGPSFEWLQKMAAQKDAAITGSIITLENGKYYNRLYFVFPDSTYHEYDKRHTFTLANEHKTYASGQERLLVTFRGWKICPLICYDLRFPVWSRNTENFDLLLYVANWPAPRISAWDALLKARAIENMSYCVGVNRVGKDGNDLDYVGHSAVYDSLGKRISRNISEGAFAEEVTLERDHLTGTRSQLKFLQDRDDFILR